jgi:hypothetical protein
MDGNDDDGNRIAVLRPIVLMIDANDHFSLSLGSK